MDQPAAVALSTGADRETRQQAARQMGSSRSERKAVAAWENGKCGGRPKSYRVSAESKARQAEAMGVSWQMRKTPLEQAIAPAMIKR